MNSAPERQPGQHYDMSKPVNDIWKDPMVQEALKERAVWDVMVMACPKCGRLGYWNEGSHFSCRFCRDTFYVSSEMASKAIRLDDTVTETTDGYDNCTLT